MNALQRLDERIKAAATHRRAVPRRRFQPPRWGYEMERRLTALINHTKEQIVTELDDRIATLTQGVNDVGTSIQTEIQQLRDAIAAGQPVTPEQLAALDDLAAKLTGDVTDLGADDPTPPPAP